MKNKGRMQITVLSSYRFFALEREWVVNFLLSRGKTSGTRLQQPEWEEKEQGKRDPSCWVPSVFQGWAMLLPQFPQQSLHLTALMCLFLGSVLVHCSVSKLWLVVDIPSMIADRMHAWRKVRSWVSQVSLEITFWKPPKIPWDFAFILVWRGQQIRRWPILKRSFVTHTSHGRVKLSMQGRKGMQQGWPGSRTGEGKAWARALLWFSW